MSAHGTRARYKAGCRCTLCKAASASARAAHRTRHRQLGPDPGELVDAKPAEFHLFTLKASGVGYRQAARLAGLSPLLVLEVRDGRRQRIRADTQAKILSVRPILAHGARVAGTKTHRHLDSLRREGFTQTRLAAHLGLRTPRLQLHSKVTVRNALRVRTLYRHLTDEGPDLPEATS